MTSIENIPEELLGILAAYCRCKDLKNLASCSRRCSDMMIPILWQSVRIVLKKLLDNKPCLFERLKYTTKLTLDQRSFPRHNHDDVDEETVSAIRSKVVHILQFCDSAKVKTLVFSNPYESTLGLALDKFRTIQDLELIDWKGWDTDEETMYDYLLEIGEADWEIKEWDVLPPAFSELKSYSTPLPDVNILFPMFDRANLKSLKVILIPNEETALRRFGAELGLEKLTLEFGSRTSTIDLTPIGQLKRLTHLELLCLWSFSEESLHHVCRNLHQLRSLAFKHTCIRNTLKLTDSSLSELKSLASLEDLTIQKTKDGSLTSKCFREISRIPRLRFLTIDAGICDNERIDEIHTNASFLNRIPSLQCIFLHVCIGDKKVSEVIGGIVQGKMWKTKYTEHGYDYTIDPDHRDGHFTFLATHNEVVEKELQECTATYTGYLP